MVDSDHFSRLEVLQPKVNSILQQQLLVFKEPNTSRRFESVCRASFLETVDIFLE